ncbi:aldehyde:ferredoxin oxidoreductase [bacterium]|nr:aldehyde:ferredoxin oxidoreductase [bacterium]MCB2179007.1 aldehyde:ferredoxin oxidoreductase [bacterium]
MEKGYTNRTLYINVGDNRIEPKAVTQEMKDIFIGGRGFGLKLLWDAVNPSTQWDSPENEIVISSGPIGGITQYPGSGKSLVVSISPTTKIVVDSNVGGYYGPYLKFAGWDAIELQGIADKEVIVYVDGTEGKVQIIEAPMETVDTHLLTEELLGMFADPLKPNLVSTVTAGTGADNTLLGCLNVSYFDLPRKQIKVKQAGRGGTGTVFRGKNIKALVVKIPKLTGKLNNADDQSLLNETGRRMNKEMKENDPVQNSMATKGTPVLVEIMDEFDLLPTHNFKFGSHPEAHKIASTVWESMWDLSAPDGCWFGCTMACAHGFPDFVPVTGPYKGTKVFVDGPEYETVGGVGSNLGIFVPEQILELNFYCDTYGIDVISYGTETAFLMECYEKGILNQERTGGLELTWGNFEAAAELLHQMGAGEGFGKIAGRGIRQLKTYFAEEYGADPQLLQDIGMEAKGMEYSEYMTKESLAMQGGYGLANKGAQHDEAWLIFMDMVLKLIPTFEDKAEALHYFPMFRTWFGLNGLCKLPWNDVEPTDNRTKYSGIDAAKVPEHVQNYVNLFVGVTGRDDIKTGEDLIEMSEAVYNFQRVFNLRMGYGRRDHDAIPYRSAGPVTVEEYESRQERYDTQLKELVGYDPEGKSTEEKVAKMRAYREDQYRKLCDAVYKRRGWTQDGIPTVETLKRLRIDFPEVVEVVEKALN